MMKHLPLHVLVLLVVLLLAPSSSTAHDHATGPFAEVDGFSINWDPHNGGFPTDPFSGTQYRMAFFFQWADGSPPHAATAPVDRSYEAEIIYHDIFARGKTVCETTPGRSEHCVTPRIPVGQYYPLPGALLQGPPTGVPLGTLGVPAPIVSYQIDFAPNWDLPIWPGVQSPVANIYNFASDGMGGEYYHSITEVTWLDLITENWYPGQPEVQLARRHNLLSRYQFLTRWLAKPGLVISAWPPNFGYSLGAPIDGANFPQPSTQNDFGSADFNGDGIIGGPDYNSFVQCYIGACADGSSP